MKCELPPLYESEKGQTLNGKIVCCERSSEQFFEVSLVFRNSGCVVSFSTNSDCKERAEQSDREKS